MSEAAEEITEAGKVMPTQMRSRGRASVLPGSSPDVRASSSAVQNIVVLPTTINLTIYQGDDFYMDMTVQDPSGTAVDLTGSQPQSQIRAKPDSPTILAVLDVTIDSTTTGLLHIHLASTDSNNIPQTAAWDIQLSSPSVTTLAAGTVTCNPQVTQ